jgi:hypothetical protein
LTDNTDFSWTVKAMYKLGTCHAVRQPVSKRDQSRSAAAVPQSSWAQRLKVMPPLQAPAKAGTPGRAAAMQNNPASAIPSPTPAYTHPERSARTARARCCNAHELVATSVQALSTVRDRQADTLPR